MEAARVPGPGGAGAREADVSPAADPTRAGTWSPADPGPLGLAGFAGTTFVLSMINTGLVGTHLVPGGGLLPLVAGVSYELVRYAAKHQASLMALLTRPGLWLQRITTQPPSNSQAEVAIYALEHAMELEKAQGGELVIA